MTRRIPIVATLVVLLAVSTMVALGFWQLARLKQKDAALALYRANMALSPAVYPLSNPHDDRLLFRTLSADCAHVADWQVIGGHARDGAVGWRHIAHCATGAGKSDLLVDMGVSSDPDVKVVWDGGPVTGRATHEPDSHSFLVRLIGGTPPLRLMIVADKPAPGLKPSPLPDPSSVPNNHLSYAVQWFSFAAIALVIYVLALRKRWREG